MPPKNKPHRWNKAQATAQGAPKKVAWQAKFKRPPGRNRPGVVRVPQGALTLSNVPLIYLNMPKAACTTIKNQFFFMEHGRYVDEPLDIHSHDDLLYSRERTPERLQLFRSKLKQRHLVFTFVRHPGKRAYS